jgi:hypothetical protein
MQTPPEISRINAGIAFTALALMAMGCFIPFVWKVIVPFATTGHAPADWTWARVFIAMCALVAVFFYLGYGMVQRFSAKLTGADIFVPTLRGGRRLRWEEIERIGTRGHELLFEGSSKPSRSTSCASSGHPRLNSLFDHTCQYGLEAPLVRPNPSLKAPTRYGSYRLAAPGQ